jgi:tubulin polyglutamylase TTLL6/13
MTLKRLIALRRRIKKNRKIVIDISETHYELIKNIANFHLNWTLLTHAPSVRDEWNIAWVDTYIHEEELRRMLPFQRINHFPGSQHLGKKHKLAANLQKM